MHYNDEITDPNPNEGANKAVKPVALIVRCLLTATLYYNLPNSQSQLIHCDSQLHRLQLIQNSLARTIFNTQIICHITPLLASLHGLKIKERIEYQLLSLTYKILTTSQANLVSLQSPHGTRSSSIATLSRPESRNARNLVS